MTNRTDTTTPAPGTLATGDYGRGTTDTFPMIVTRVGPAGRTLWTRRLELDETTSRNENPNLAEGELPVRLTDGDPNRPYGDEVRWTLRQNGAWGHGDQRIRFGRAVRRVDYKV